MPKTNYVATYDLAWLHGKQGDDLSVYSTKKRAAPAFRAWAKQLERAARDAHRVADALRGCQVEVSADGSGISLTVFDEKAKRGLDELVKLRLASRFYLDDDEADVEHGGNCGCD